MTRNSTERLDGEYDLESRRSAFSSTSSQHQVPTHPFQASINVVLCWFQRMGVFARSLYCCSTVLEYLTYRFFIFLAICTFVARTNRVVFERNLQILTSRKASLFVASARSGRVVPKNSHIPLVIRSGRWTWGGYYRTARRLSHFH